MDREMNKVGQFPFPDHWFHYVPVMFVIHKIIRHLFFLQKIREVTFFLFSLKCLLINRFKSIVTLPFQGVANSRNEKNELFVKI